MAIEFTAQPTPNPNAIKINANQQLFEGPGSISLKFGEPADHPLANALVSIEGIDNIFGINDFVTISKKPEADWDTIMPAVEEALKKLY